MSLLNWKGAAAADWSCYLGWDCTSEPGQVQLSFLLLVPLLPRNIKCLLAMVISNGETNTGEFSIYKNSVK